jgi:hypothetical protein
MLLKPRAGSFESAYLLSRWIAARTCSRASLLVSVRIDASLEGVNVQERNWVEDMYVSSSVGMITRFSWKQEYKRMISPRAIEEGQKCCGYEDGSKRTKSKTFPNAKISFVTQQPLRPPKVKMNEFYIKSRAFRALRYNRYSTVYFQNLYSIQDVVSNGNVTIIR